MIAVTNQYQNDKYDTKKTVLSGWKFKPANNDRRASNHKNIQLSKNLSYSHESIFHLENGFHIQVRHIRYLTILSIAHCIVILTFDKTIELQNNHIAKTLAI